MTNASSYYDGHVSMSLSLIAVSVPVLLYSRLRKTSLIYYWLVCLVVLLGCDDYVAGGVESDSNKSGQVHPDGFNDPDVHGTQAKGQELDCTSCHGDDLKGDGDAISCDSCHDNGWRSDCTFCHGGEANQTGAPPESIFAEVDGDRDTFVAHTAHVTENIKPAYECEECHVTPANVLSPNHFIIDDSTPAEAEVQFAGGLSVEGNYLGDGTCSNIYCHGNGQEASAQVDHKAFSPECDSCHKGPNSSSDEWREMSGKHRPHLREGLECQDCHGDTVQNNQIANPNLHVNGTPDLNFDGDMNYEEGQCFGECHNESHDDRNWVGSTTAN